MARDLAWANLYHIWAGDLIYLVIVATFLSPIGFSNRADRGGELQLFPVEVEDIVIKSTISIFYIFVHNNSFLKVSRTRVFWTLFPNFSEFSLFQILVENLVNDVIFSKIPQGLKL